MFAPSPFKPDALHNELHNAFSLQPKVDERPTFLAVFEGEQITALSLNEAWTMIESKSMYSNSIHRDQEAV